MKKLLPHAISTLVAATFAGQALAVEPMGIKTGGVTITPTLDFSEMYDDNIRTLGVDEESSWVTRISPNVLIEAIDRLNVYQLEYGFESDIFHSSRDDDNTDHNLRGSAHFEINSRNRLDLAASYSKYETITDTTVVGENDRFNVTSVEGTYGFGLPGATMNLDLGVYHDSKRTDNNGTLNAAREYDMLGYKGIVYYRLAPKTRALVEYRSEEYDYESAGSLRNSDREIGLVGLTWAATAKTIGSIKVGYEERDFDANQLDDPDGTYWEADISWQPRTYSIVNISTRKGIEEGQVTDQFVDATHFDVNWNHHWTELVYTDVSYSYSEEDFEDVTGREDEVNAYGLSINYDVMRWMTVGVGYQYKDRDSNIAVRDSDRNLYMLNMQFSL